MSRKHTQSNPVHTCPECGGDTTRIRDRHPFTTHGSRAYLWLLFIIITVSYVVALLLVSNFGRHTTDHTLTPKPKATAAAIPYAPPVDAGSASFHELSMALEGDDDALAMLREQLRSSLAGENPYNATQMVERVRLEARHPTTSIHSTSSYNLLGMHANHSQVHDFSNPRTREPANPTAQGRGITYLTWWPGFHMQISDPGGHERSYSANYFTIMGLVTLLALLSLVAARLLPRRWGRRRVFWGMLCTLLLGSVITMMLTREQREFNLPTYAMPITQGPWIEANQAQAAVDDNEALQALLDQMRAGFVIPGSTPAAIVIGREYRAPQPDPEMPKALTTDWWGWWVLGQGTIDIFSVRTSRFDGDRTPEQRRAAHSLGFWYQLYRWGRARIELRRPRSTISIDFNITHTALILGIPWWIWLALTRIHRLRTWRVQRKRVNRGQCIYCGYRATDEALAARWEVRDTHNPKQSTSHQ